MRLARRPLLDPIKRQSGLSAELLDLRRRASNIERASVVISPQQPAPTRRVAKTAATPSFVPSGGGPIYVNLDDGSVLAYDQNADTWSALTSPPISQGSSVRFWNQGVYLRMLGSFFEDLEGSDDTGITWFDTDVAIADGSIAGIHVVTPDHGNRIWFAADVNATQDQLFYTDDEGASVSMNRDVTTSFIIINIGCHPTDQDRIALLVANVGGAAHIYLDVTTNRGTSWTRYLLENVTPVPTGDFGSMVRWLSNGRIVIAYRTGVSTMSAWYADSDGASITAATGFPSGSFADAYDVVGNSAFVGITDSGVHSVYATPDGATWADQGGLGTNDTIESLGDDGVGTLYVRTANGGVFSLYKVPNADGSWSPAVVTDPDTAQDGALSQVY